MGRTTKHLNTMIKTCLVCFIVTTAVASELSTDFPDSELPRSCLASVDDTYGGITVDCTGAGMNSSSEIKTKIRASRVTSLILSGNPLLELGNDTFERLTDIRSLSLDNCLLYKIQLHTFRGLLHLQRLVLSKNNLRFGDDHLPFHVFDDTPNLNILALDLNKYSASNGTYAHYINIFHTRSNLTSLYIDSFTHMYIGHEFSKLRMLLILNINCKYLENVYNNSLEGLTLSTVKNLTLQNGKNIFHLNFDQGVFHSLPVFMDLLEIREFYIGNHRILGSMRSLQGKTIKSLVLVHLSQNSWVQLSAYDHYMDGYIGPEATKQLANVCVSHITYAHCSISSFDVAGLITGPFKNCVKSIDLSGNTITVGNQIDIYVLKEFRFLEEITFSTEDYSKTTPNFWELTSNDTLRRWRQTTKRKSVTLSVANDVDSQYKKPSIMLTTGSQDIPFPERINGSQLSSTSSPPSSAPSSLGAEVAAAAAASGAVSSATKLVPSSRPMLSEQSTNSRMMHSRQLSFTAVSMNAPFLKNGVGESENHSNLHHPYWQTMSREHSSHPKMDTQTKSPNLQTSKETIWLPKNLKTVRLDNAYTIISFDNDINFKTPNVLHALYMRFAFRSLIFHGQLRGLDSLARADFTGSDLYMFENVFDNLSSLKSLILKNTQSNPAFLRNSLTRILRYNNKLEYFDISQNGLNALPRDAFKHNSKLRYLCLASNRFSHIPFNMEFTPELEILDLRSNSIASFSDKDMAFVDAHLKLVSNFTILLHGNSIVCTCSTFTFIVWMSRARTHFDDRGNLLCMSENGLITFTTNESDVLVQWRRCKGDFYLMLSLIVASALVAMYLAMFLGSRYKTLVVTKVLRYIVPGFITVLRRNDFAFDVFVGYTDTDVMFVRDELLPFLEGEWNLRTFIHQRDLRQDRLEMIRALRQSWRCILLLSEAFVNGTDMEHNVMKTACLFTSPGNLGKVVVIVEECMQYRIPVHVLEAVDEDDIIVLPNFNCCSLDKNAIRTLARKLEQEKNI